jgi:endogenous inhibitor of DNA gyrase (YacG/DUF329 family)
MSSIRCSICGQTFDTENSKFSPFCSGRCKNIDLGRWLGEQYGMPYESPDEPEDAPAEER